MFSRGVRLASILSASTMLSLGAHLAVLSSLSRPAGEPSPLAARATETYRPPQAWQARLALSVPPGPSQGTSVSQDKPRQAADTAEAVVTQTAAEPDEADVRLEPQPSPSLPHFVPALELERPAVPKSAPEIEALNNTPVTGLPIRLRLFIDESGTVVRIDVLQASEDDAPAIEQIKSVFYATAFLAGQQHGADVASYKDIEIRLNDAT